MKANNLFIPPIILNVLLIVFLFISDIQQTILLSALLFVSLGYILKGVNYRKFLGICLLSIFPGIFSFIAIIYIMGGFGNYDFITFINSTYQSLIIIFIFAFVFANVGYIISNKVKRKFLSKTIFISLLALLLSLLTGAINWQTQFVLTSIIYFIGGILTKKINNDRQFIKYLILTAPFILLYGIPIIIDNLMHVIFIPITVALSSFLGFVFVTSKKASNIKTKIIILSLMVMILICGYIGMMNWTRYVFNSKYSEITKQTFIKEIKHENGFPISPTVFENKLSVMFFWTTSCGVCYKKFPDLQELYIDYSDNKDIAISAVNVLYPKESPSDIYHSIRERGWSFPLFFLAKDDLNKYDDVDLNFYPYVLVLDYDNTVLYSGGFNYHPLVFVDNVRTIIEKYHNRTNKQSKNHL